MSIRAFLKSLEMKSNVDVWLVALLFITITLRIFFWSTYFPVIAPDTEWYVKVANYIIHWNWNEYDGGRTVGYPAFLALTAIGVGKLNLYIAVFIQLVLGALIAVMLYLLLLRLTKNKVLSFVMALMQAVSFNFIHREMIINTEVLLAFLLMTALYLFEHLRNQIKPSYGGFMLLAVNVALLFLIRPSGLIQFPVFVLMVWFFSNERWTTKSRVVITGGFFVIVFVILLSWCFIVKSFSGTFSVTSLAGVNLTHQVVAFYHKLPDKYSHFRDTYRECRERNPELNDLQCIRRLASVLGPNVTKAELYRELTPVSTYLIWHYPHLYLNRVGDALKRSYDLTFNDFNGIEYSREFKKVVHKFRSPEHGHAIRSQTFHSFLQKAWYWWQYPFLRIVLILFLIQVVLVLLLFMVRVRIKHMAVYFLSTMMFFANLLLSAIMETGQTRFILPLQPMLLLSLGLGGEQIFRFIKERCLLLRKV